MYFDSKYLYIVLAVIVITSVLSGGFNLLSILLTLPGVLIAITFHEYAHALAAYKLGDDTPKYQGRLSLNPLTHLDPIAVIMLLFTHIGWGKPVQVNPNNFTRKISARAGEAIVAAAGPLMNFILALVGTIIFYALQVFATSFAVGTQAGLIIMTMLQYAVIVNIGLGVFNLIPLPPLDGSKVLMLFLPYNAKRWFEEHTNIFYIVFIVIWITPIAGLIISPIIEAIAYGINSLVGAIFGLFI
ncbi:MAG: site-2 protease family protein [Clostridia bacterium]